MAADLDPESESESESESEFAPESEPAPESASAFARHDQSVCKCTDSTPAPTCYAPITKMSHRTSIRNGIQILRDRRLKGGEFWWIKGSPSVIQKRAHSLNGKLLVWFGVDSPAHSEIAMSPAYGNIEFTSSLPVQDIIDGSLEVYFVEFRQFKCFTACILLLTKLSPPQGSSLMRVDPRKIGHGIAIFNDQLWALQRIIRDPESNSAQIDPLDIQLIFLDEEGDVLSSLYPGYQVTSDIPQDEDARTYVGKFVVFSSAPDELKVVLRKYVQRLGEIKASSRALRRPPFLDPRKQDHFEKNLDFLQKQLEELSEQMEALGVS